MAEDVVSLRQMAAAIAAIDTRTTDMNRKLDQLTDNLNGLARATSRAPDGRTLINLVMTILNDVQH
jgi:hypothetical protein